MSDMAGGGVGCNLHRYTGSNLRLLKMYVIPFYGLEEYETKVIATACGMGEVLRCAEHD